MVMWPCFLHQFKMHRFLVEVVIGGMNQSGCNFELSCAYHYHHSPVCNFLFMVVYAGNILLLDHF